MPDANDDLLDRYLHAVRFWLPKPQQQDIVAELAEDLHSQIEEREEALGHPLEIDELAALLKQRGAPMRVASSYLPELRLVNPAMLPAYRLVLKIALLWVLAPLFVIVYVGPLITSAHPERVLLAFWAQAWQTGFMVIGMVTVIFAAMDRYHLHVSGGRHHLKVTREERWDPRKLPRVPSSQDTAARWNHLAGFIFGMIAAVVWVYLFFQRPGLSVPGGIRIVLGSIWKYTYWPILLVTLTSASADLLAFLYPCWARTRARLRLGVDGFMLIMVVAIVYSFANWVDIVAPNTPAQEIARIMVWVNASIGFTLGAIAVTTLIDAIRQVRLLMRGAMDLLF